MLQKKDIPQNWHITTLDKICVVERGITFPADAKRDIPSDSTIACLRTSNVQENIDWSDLIYIPKTYVSDSVKLIRVGDVLISLANSSNLVGKVSFVRDIPVESTFGGFISAIRTKSNLIDPFYLYQYLNSDPVQSLFRSWASQTTSIANLTVRDLVRLEVPLPPLPEQQRIVAILRKADELHQLRRQATARAKELLPALFYEMFGKKWQSWSRGKIGDIIYFETGKSIASESVPARDGKWGILKVSAVTLGEFKPEENKQLPDDAEFASTLQVRHGDLLVTRANTSELVGASALVYNPPPRLIIPDKIWRVVLKEESNANLAFLHALFNVKEVRREISRRATGTSASMKNISQEKFLDINLPLPPFELQHQYGEITEYVHNQIKSHQEVTTEKIEVFSTALLRYAFTGELTAEWRNAHIAELTEIASERERLLGLAQIIHAESLVEIQSQVGTATLTVTPNRAVYSELDTVIQSVLTSVQSHPAYFRQEDLVIHHDLTTVQAVAGLHVLEALGFVRQVVLDRQLFYRMIDPIRDSASKPELLQ